MLDLRMPYLNRDRRLAAPDVFDPFIMPEDPQSCRAARGLNLDDPDTFLRTTHGSGQISAAISDSAAGA
jgi:hypothetical protein